MVGALFIYPMFKAIRAGNKTQTSRFGDKPLWKEGQKLYIKEPAYLYGRVGENPPDNKVIYQKGDAKFTGVEYAWDNGVPANTPDVFWIEKKKLFCPEKAARLFIEVESVTRKRLGDFTIEDYKREGLIRDMSLPIPDFKIGEPSPPLAMRPTIVWRLELANDLVKTADTPLELWEYLLKLTDKDFQYDPERLAWVYKFKVVE